MFTGLIEQLGQINAIHKKNDDIVIELQLLETDSLSQIKIGDSIAINGVCLTVVSKKNNFLLFDVSTETLSKTSLKQLKHGIFVNIEQAMQVSDRLGGHIVSGHVDGLAILKECYEDGRSKRLSYQLVDQALAHYIVTKGSVCIDGVSLTINEVNDNTFGVNIIPHTWEHTIMQHYKIGQYVNIEVDVIARYVERMLTFDSGGQAEQKKLGYQHLQKL